MPVWKHLYLETLKEYVQDCYNITLSLIVTIKLIWVSFWLSPLNSNFILLADFPFMRAFQCPVYLSCIIIQSTSIPLKYHLFVILTLKILPNSIFSIFLFCPLWRPIIILHFVSSMGYITLSIGYNSQSLSFWESEGALTSNLEISTNKKDIYCKAGTCAKYTKEAKSFKNGYVFI